MKRLTQAAPAAPGFFRSVLKPLVLSFAITLLSLGILAACIAFGPVTENAAEPCILLSVAVSIFIGAFLFSRVHGSRGLLAGLFFGLLYIGVSVLTALAFFGSVSPETSFIKRLPIGAITGMLGGIMGVNIRKKRR